MSTQDLPPLPPTKYRLGVEGDGYSPDRLLNEEAYDADMTRAYAEAYAAQAVAAAVERCAKLCEQTGEVAAGMYGDDAERLRTAEMCAEAIRGVKP